MFVHFLRGEPKYMIPFLFNFFIYALVRSRNVIRTFLRGFVFYFTLSCVHIISYLIYIFLKKYFFLRVTFPTHQNKTSPYMSLITRQCIYAFFDFFFFFPSSSFVSLRFFVLELELLLLLLLILPATSFGSNTFNFVNAFLPGLLYFTIANE